MIFSDTMLVRFPLLYMIELQNSLQQQVEERTKELKEEKNNSEKLLIEFTQALATTIEWRKIIQKNAPKKTEPCKYIGQTGFEPATSTSRTGFINFHNDKPSFITFNIQKS